MKIFYILTLFIITICSNANAAPIAQIYGKDLLLEDIPIKESIMKDICFFSKKMDPNNKDSDKVKREIEKIRQGAFIETTVPHICTSLTSVKIRSRQVRYIDKRILSEQGKILHDIVFNELIKKVKDADFTPTSEEARGYEIAMKKMGKVDISERDVRRDIREWKINRYLYNKYGGAVITSKTPNNLKPAGAHYTFLLEAQKNGEFKIFDKKLNMKLWEYYVTTLRLSNPKVERKNINFEIAWWDWK